MNLEKNEALSHIRKESIFQCLDRIHRKITYMTEENFEKFKRGDLMRMQVFPWGQDESSSVLDMTIQIMETSHEI